MKKIYLKLMALVLLSVLSITNAWAGTPNLSGFGFQFRDDNGTSYKTGTKGDGGIMDVNFGSKTNLKLIYIYANGNKNGGNLCGDNYFKYEIYGTTGEANWGGTNRESCIWSGDVPTYKWGTEDSESAWIDLVKDRKPGDYNMQFFFSFEGNDDSRYCGSWYDCKYNNGNWKFSWTIPEPTITITGASSLVVGTSTNITADIRNYPVGATLTNVSVSGNIASTASNTGSGSSITVSSVTPNASGANGITVTVTVTYGSAGTKDYVYTYDVTPPAVSDYTVTPSGSGYLSSGSGTAGSPWLVTYNGTLTLGLSGATQAYTDANSAAEYSTDGGSSYGTTGSNISITRNNITSTSNADWHFKARLKNTTTSSLLGAVNEKIVYWKVPTYTVTLDKNGSGADGSATATHGTTSLSPLSAPTKTGYDVEGYYSEDGSEDDWGDKVADDAGNLQASATYTDASSKWNSMSNQTLYTKWTAHTYTITLDKGTGGTNNGSASVTYDNNELTSISHATKTGYSLAGYYDEDGTTKVLNADGTFANSTVSGYITSGLWTKAANCTLYAQWTENLTTVTLTASPAGKGSFTIGGAAATSTTAGVTTTRDVTAVPADGYYVNTSSTVWSASNGNISLSSPTAATTTVTGAGTTSTSTLTATFTPNPYSVRFNRNGGTGGADMANQAFTYDVAQNLTTCSFSKTGYTFGGWATTAERAAAGTKDYDNGVEVTNLTTTKNGVYDLYAIWTANGYTVTLDVDEEHKGTIASATTSQSVTYNAATEDVPALPTGADGYSLDGYYTAQLGEGTKLINANGTWIASVTGYTDGSGNWVHDGNVTLYAYYKKAELSLELEPSTQAPNGTVTATPTLSPAPDGTTTICWRLLRANGNEMPGVTFTPTGVGNAVSFPAPGASGAYKVACILHAGSAECNNPATVLDSIVADLTVAGEHTVTIRYQDSDGRTLATSTEMTGRPLVWSGAIEPATITGYTFHHWKAGDGITLSKDGSAEHDKDTAQVSTIYIKATYEGTLTAVYNKRRMIYFNNTLGWEHVYVYFYSDATAWDDSDNGQGTSSKRGSGAKTDKKYNGSSTPYSAGQHGEMQNIAGTNIWYFDMATAGYADCANITFTKDDQHGYEYFSNTEVARVTGAPYNSTTLPMYVPLKGVTEEHNKLSGEKAGQKAVYYTQGYWMNYPENTGYWLKIYEGTTADVADEIHSIPFEFTGSKTMPMELTVELNAARTYGFEIYRNDNKYYGNNFNMTSGNSGDEGQTSWQFETGRGQRAGLKTSAAGNYKFKLSYGEDAYSAYNYLVGVHYPATTGSYRIVYKDLAIWSQGSAHTASWNHPSRAIEKKDGANDIVSFYVKVDANTSMKFQYASAVNAETGVVTWSNGTDAEHTDVSIDLSSIEESGVYNFYLSQPNGAIRVDSIRPYTGKYYIRTNNAGSSGWDNYRAADHRMTYTDFSKNSSTNTFGDLYSHYYMRWCPRSTNISFVIANDYSSCITDTLKQDVNNPYSNTDAEGTLNNDGDGGHTGDYAYLDRYSANVRFMYNESTNMISRAYMSSSTDKTRKFLILRSNTEFTNSDGTALSDDGETSTTGTYEAIFQDDQDWIYEREVKVLPSSKFKLYACYAQESVSEDRAQYFRGVYEAGDWDDEDKSIKLIGGSGSACKVRLVYDFKTNRLMSAYVPEEGDIDGTKAINADIMLVRNHQEAGQQITFATAESQLTDVKTVYGVMRFNRWILNNRQNPNDQVKEHCDTHEHINENHPLITNPADLKSSSERGLYWISFPFDVKLSEVFGFGTYGTDWVFLGYNGADRAENGYWVDSESFWEYIWDRQDTVLQAGHGIVLALDLDRMDATNTSFWKNEIQQIELFFPSMSSTTGTITQTDAEVTFEPHECTIDRRTQAEKDANVQDIHKNRTVVDSHWNILGVPSYANYGTTLTNVNSTKDSTITWKDDPETDDLPFLYEWNANDNTYTVQSGNSFPFKAMHAYYVQFAGKIKWTLASATPIPSPIAARRTNAEHPQRVEFKLELQQNNKMIDQTFVKLKDDEEVSTNFVFGEDLSKSLNKNKANIYTIVEGYLPVAGNTMPMSEQTMLIPVGVKPATDGEYTFSMPDGTSGIGVTLIDNVANTRTNLGLTDYTVTLTADKINDRFMLEISPIQQTPTDIDETSIVNRQSSNRKLLIDGILYIVKDGVVFDATGKRLQ